MPAHSAAQHRTHALRVCWGLIHGDIDVEYEHHRTAAGRYAGRCQRRRTDFPDAVTIVITRPLVLTVVDGRVGRHHPVVIAVLVQVNDLPISRDRLGDVTFTDRPIRLQPTGHKPSWPKPPD